MEKLDLKKSILMVTGIVLGFSNSIAQVPGEIDNDWGFSGWISTDHVTNAGEFFYDMITLENDDFLMVGGVDDANLDMLIVKYNSDGSLDESFGDFDGIQRIDLSIGGEDVALSVEELHDGKLLISGSTETANGLDMALIRLEADGSFDYSFGNSGKVLYSSGANTWTFPTQLNVLADNSIIVGASILDGTSNIGVLKFTQGGGLDLSFGDNGVFIFENLNTDDELTGMEVTDVGEVYTTWIADNGVNKAAILMKLDNTGALDNSFGSSGTDGITEYFVAAENYFNDLKIDENGKIIVVGHEGSGDDFDGIIIRYNADGLIDQSFATNGKITLDIGASDGILLNNLEIIQDGKMLASGNASGQTLKQVYAFMFDEAGNSVCDFSACSGMYASYTFAPVEYKGDLLTLLSDGSILLGGHATSQDFVGEQMYVTKVFNVNQVADLSSQTVDESKISVYPNPTRSQFTIKLNKGEEIVETQLINPQGRTVQSWNEHATNFYLNGNIASGSYYIKVQTNKTVYTNNLTIK